MVSHGAYRQLRAALNGKSAHDNSPDPGLLAEKTCIQGILTLAEAS